MSTLEIGQAAPDFSLPATSDRQISLSELRGQQVVLFFYPKDSTPGCTTEGQNFRDNAEAFAAANTLVFGISKDGLVSHEKFKAKQEFNFELISDEDEVACQAYAVIKEKNMYGKKFMGIERSTFLIDANGNLKQIWRKVKVPGHVDAVLAAAQG